MSENTAGYYCEPPEDQADNYEKRADGKWYIKAELEDAVATCGTPWIKTQRTLNAADYVVDDDKLNNGDAINDFKPWQWPSASKHVGDVNSKEKGSAARYNGDKPPMHYIPLEQQLAVFGDHLEMDMMRDILWELADFEVHRSDEMGSVLRLLTPADLIEASYVWQYGAKKYAAWNWAKGMAWSVPLGCISRHMMAILTGEQIDSESHYSHWAHIVCNILMLDHYSRYFQEGDDRPPAEIFR